MRKHGKYFLNRRICEALDSLVVEKAPFNMLSRDEWYQIVNHVIGHEVQQHMQQSVPRGATMNSLNDGDVRYFLWVTLERYLQTNSAVPQVVEDGVEYSYMSSSCIPKEEMMFAKRASNLYLWLEDRFRVLDEHLNDEQPSHYIVVPLKEAA